MHVHTGGRTRNISGAVSCMTPLKPHNVSTALAMQCLFKDQRTTRSGTYPTVACANTLHLHGTAAARRRRPSETLLQPETLTREFKMRSSCANAWTWMAMYGMQAVSDDMAICVPLYLFDLDLYAMVVYRGALCRVQGARLRHKKIPTIHKPTKIERR